MKVLSLTPEPEGKREKREEGKNWLGEEKKRKKKRRKGKIKIRSPKMIRRKRNQGRTKLEKRRESVATSPDIITANMELAGKVANITTQKFAQDSKRVDQDLTDAIEAEIVKTSIRKSAEVHCRGSPVKGLGGLATSFILGSKGMEKVEEENPLNRVIF